ncbi:2-hydroxycarboxylate transporter family protein [Clostridium felsineum]|uniref:Citrate/malate transporter n=1 Tax=Clostridium felsineum TaxID=36839 RepID=A0A1S8MG18_9CLOT|nr:2-hydroxycarboxylate transporter family protein [Clostridium felsineum]URZ05347.1 Citrate/malate transporter [Clostridium felsineum]URZ10388.1 Citrate/malate transporter [Clostridium felsineum]
MIHKLDNSQEINKKSRFWSIKISGVSIPVYIIMMIILVIEIKLGRLPNTMLGALAVLILLGNLFHYIGNHLPIFKSYLGGGSVFCIFASAIIATFGILPSSSVKTITSFVNDYGFLDFYIAALITGSVLGMKRDLLIKAAIRFIPVAFISMVISALVVALIGVIIGHGLKNSLLYISLPIMAGGVGAGCVPLSGIYASALGKPASGIISLLIPASALGNVIAIVFAALVSKIGASFPKYNGNGKLIKGDIVATESQNKEEIKLDIVQIGVGLVMSLSFFMLGNIINDFVPKVHAYAFMIIIVVICKVTNIIPKYYEDSAVMFNKIIMKNLTPAVLSAIGIALLNLDVLGKALTWQFVLLCFVSVITISVASAILGKIFGLYPVESIISAGLCNNSMGGTGNVAVLSAANRMELIAFAQMGNRLGGAIVLIVGSFLVRILS